MVGRKAFLANPKHQYRVYQWGEPDCSAITNRIEIIMSIQVCAISPVNINYRENVGLKSFSCNRKHQNCVPQCGEHDCSGHNEKNED